MARWRILFYHYYWKRKHMNFFWLWFAKKYFFGFSVFSLAVAPSIQSLVWQMYHSWRRAQAIQIRGFYHQTLSLRKFFFSLCQINWLTMQHFRTKDWSHDSSSSFLVSQSTLSSSKLSLFSCASSCQSHHNHSSAEKYLRWF